MLDTILVNIKETCPTELHPEDVIIDPALMTKTTDGDIKLLQRRIKKDAEQHEYVYYDENYMLIDDDYPDVGEEGFYSLMAVVPENLELRREGKKILASFDYNSVHYYDLRVLLD